MNILSWIITKLCGDKSLTALLRLRAEIRDLEQENATLRKKVALRSDAMKAIVKAAKENCDDIFFY